MTAPRDPRELRRFALFLGAGVLNTAFGYAAFAVLLRVGAGNDLAVLLGTLAGIAFNFRTLGAVFATRGWARLPQFVLAYALLIPGNVALLRMAVRAGTGPYLGEVLALAVVTPISFVLMRNFVFAAPGRATP